MKKLFLFDIEGTTTDIHFVHKILFPYSRKKISEFVLNHFEESNVKIILESAQQTIWEESHQAFDIENIIHHLILWIDRDRKHPALKEIQGLIWESGYKKKDFHGHLYDDVLPFFEKIKNQNHEIGIYSSGSVWAQKLIFKHSIFGDLSPFISFYFDTKIGAKRESASYKNILNETKFHPQHVYFFSDIKEELEAASEVEIRPIQLERYEIQKSHYKIIKNFSEFIF